MGQPRMTLATRRVLKALLDRPADERYGLEISDRAGLPGGTIYPILARFEQIGWLESRWEDLDPHQVGRPRRRYYRLSREGAELARDALIRAERPRGTRYIARNPLGENPLGGIAQNPLGGSLQEPLGGMA